jgi:hypothetical protein
MVNMFRRLRVHRRGDVDGPISRIIPGAYHRVDTLCHLARPRAPQARRRANAALTRNSREVKADKKNQKVKRQDRIAALHWVFQGCHDLSWLRASSVSRNAVFNWWRDSADGAITCWCKKVRCGFREAEGIRRNHNCERHDDEATWFVLGARQFVNRVSRWAF